MACGLMLMDCKAPAAAAAGRSTAALSFTPQIVVENPLASPIDPEMAVLQVRLLLVNGW